MKTLSVSLLAVLVAGTIASCAGPEVQEVSTDPNAAAAEPERVKDATRVREEGVGPSQAAAD